jgi:uncharacterized RDD family membrane protein YckC
LALLTDMVTVLFVNLGLVLVGGAALVDRAVDRWSPEPWGDSFVPTLVYAALFLVYETAFVAARGQTPGMDLLHLKAVVATTGAHPRVARALVRTVPLVALRLVPGALAGTVAMLALGVTCPFDRQRRAINDLLAGTVVIDYDADAGDDGALGPIDRDELAATYGPRRLVDVVKRLGK